MNDVFRVLRPNKSRDFWVRNPCPNCGAESGHPCQSNAKTQKEKRRNLTNVHKERKYQSVFTRPMKNITITIRPYTHECGDGCCYEYGETIFVDGVEVASGPCEHNRLIGLLEHLGFSATIIGQDLDGEDSWSL